MTTGAQTRESLILRLRSMSLDSQQRTLLELGASNATDEEASNALHLLERARRRLNGIKKQLESPEPVQPCAPVDMIEAAIAQETGVTVGRAVTERIVDMVLKLMSSPVITPCINEKQTEVQEWPNFWSNRITQRVFAPQDLQQSSVLSYSETTAALAKMEVVARHIEPNFIVGINKGGAFLTHYFMERMKIGEGHTANIACDKKTGKISLSKHWLNPTMTGRILIVDDVCRTGKTLSRVREYVAASVPQCELFAIAMVAVLPKIPETTPQVPDYWVFHTGEERVRLPWSRGASSGKSVTYHIGPANSGMVIQEDQIETLMSILTPEYEYESESGGELCATNTQLGHID